MYLNENLLKILLSSSPESFFQDKFHDDPLSIILNDLLFLEIVLVMCVNTSGL